MAENRPICVLCNRSVVNRRRLEITHALFEENAANAQYIIEAIAPQQVSIFRLFFLLFLPVCTHPIGAMASSSVTMGTWVLF